MFKKILTTVEEKVSGGGSHLFGVSSKWRLILSSTIILSAILIASAYYVWYDISFGKYDQAESGGSTSITMLDQKKLREMISDLDMREQMVFGTSTATR